MTPLLKPQRGYTGSASYALSVDDEQAATMYSSLSSDRSNLSRQTKLDALESWAKDKIARDSERQDAEFDRMYNDLPGWWKETGDDVVDEEVKLRTANRKFIASQFGSSPEEQIDLYPSFRNQWTLANFGKKDLSESETFNMIRDSINGRKQINQSLDMITGDVALALFDQADAGKPVDVPTLVSKWKEENADLVSNLPDQWEPNILKAAGEYYADTEKMLRDHGDVVQRLYAHMVKATGREVEGAPENDPKTQEDVTAMIDELAALPQDVRDRAKTAILMAAKRQGMEDKTFGEMAGEAWVRSLNMVRTTGLVAQEMEAQQRLALLKAEGPVYRDPLTGGILGQGGALQAQSGQAIRQGEPISEEDRSTMVAQAEKDLSRLNVIRELRDFADNRFDPVKANAKSGVGQFFQNVALLGPQSLAYTAMAAVPFAGPALTGAAIFSEEYNQLRNEGFQPDQAKTLAAVSAPIQTAAEVFGAKLIFGRYKWYRDVIQKMVNPARFARTAQATVSFFGKVVGENATEATQDLTTPIVQDLASRLSEDYPEVDWQDTLSKFADSRLDVFAATLMPIIGGHTVDVWTDNKRFKSYDMRDKLMYSRLGFTEEEKAYVEDATTPREQSQRYAEVVKNMPADRVNATKEKIAAETKIAADTQLDATTPTIETARTEDGRLEYIIRDEAGAEVFRTFDQAGAEEAYLLTTAKSTAAKFQADRVATQELLQWWTSQDPNNVVEMGETRTAQQELERLQGLGDAAQIEALHRRIAQIPASATGGMVGPGVDYSQLNILGTATVETVAEGVFRGVIALNQSSRPKDALEEINHVFVRRAKAQGRVNDNQLREWITATESVTGETYAKETFDDIVESMAVIAEAYAAQRIDQNAESQLPTSFVDYLKRLVQVLKEVLTRGMALRQGFSDGTLGNDYEQFLAESVGLADQTQVDNARQRTEQEVRAVQNYSIGVSSQQDTDHLAAVERGDMETAQRMVDEAARRAGYDVGTVYHGTNRNFNKFSKEVFANFNNAQKKLGFFFTPEKDYAQQYGGRVVNAYLRGNFKKESTSLIDEIETDWTNQKAGSYVARLKREGFDGVIFDGATKEIAVFNPNQIKSADPVTYDAKGNVIPLSQRFDATTADINYSIGSRAVLSEIDRVLDMPENPPSVPTAAQEGGKVRSIAKLFHAIMDGDSIDYGSLDEDGMAERVSQAGDRILDILLRASYEFPNFASWYESRLKMALAIFQQLDPDVAKPDNQAALLVTLAITSNGADVATQTEDGWDVYNHWKQTGKLAGSPEKRGALRGAETENKLGLADRMAAALGGYAKLGEFLNRKGTVSELRAAMAEQFANEFTKQTIIDLTNGELVSEIIPFSLVFGAKLGSFFNNMSGDFSTITMDRWFMRTFGRTMGTQLVAIAKDVMAKKDARLKQALKGYKGDILKRAKIEKGVKDPRQIAEALGKFFQKKENRSNLSEQETSIRLAANDLFKVADGFVLNEAPDSGTHRRWIRAVMTDGINKFNEQTGKQLVPAEAQALLWYYEKLIHDTLGSRQKDASPDYASAANKLFIRERGTGSDRFSDSDGIKRRSDGGRSQAFGGLPVSGKSGAARVGNYSIAAQPAIDRVAGALSALDRDPLQRVKIYEKVQEKFLQVMAQNRDKLSAMAGGNPTDIRRTQILQSLGELDGILSALPPEIRSKVGGYTQLAKIDPMDVYKGDQKISEVSGMQGALISAWMREGLNIGEAQKKTEFPEGYRSERNMDTGRADRAIADVFIARINRMYDVLERFLRDEYNTAAVELFRRARPQRDAPGEKPKGKLDPDVHDLFNTLKEATEWSAEQAAAYATSQIDRAESGELNPSQAAHAFLVANTVELFADWENADSTQRAAAVSAGQEIFNRAYKANKQKLIAQRQKRGYDRTDLSDDAGVAADDEIARQTRMKKDNSLPKKWENVSLNLVNFGQLMTYIFGDSKVGQQLTDRQRKADNAKSDDIAKLSGDWDAFLSKLGKGTAGGHMLLFNLSRMDKEIDGIPYSQNQLMAITMMWLQPKGRQHMEGYMDSDGQPAGKWHYNQDFVNKAERQLSPEAKQIRDYLLRQYAEEYDSINKVYRKVYGMNLPRNAFYSPLVVESIRAASNTGVDPVTGAVFAPSSNSPGALRSRGGAIAQPVFRDAVQTYFAHMLQMAHWKAYAEFNSEVAAVLGHRDTRMVVKGKAGEQAAKVIGNWLDYFAMGGNKDAANQLAINEFLNRMTGNFATMALFGRVSTLALQITQLGAASAKMPTGAYLLRLGKLLSGNLSWKSALDSDYIQRRIKDMPPAVAMAMQGLRAEKPNMIRNAARALGQLISGFDGLATAGTYAMVYDYQLSQATKNGLAGQEAQEYAREATERIVDDVAQPTRAGTRSIYELNMTHPVARAAWAFSSESRKNLGMVLAANSGRDLSKALVYVVLLNGLVGGLIRSAFRDIRDDDDDEIFDEKNWGWNRLAAMFISDPLYGFPIIGEAAESAVYNAFGVYNPSGPLFDIAPGVPAAKRLAYDYPTGEKEANMRDIVRDVNRVLSTAGLFNSQIAAAASLSNLVKDVYEGVDANLLQE